MRNIREGKPTVHILEGHTDSLNCVQFDESKLVSGSLDRTIRIWDIKSWRCTSVLKGHTATVWCLQYIDNTLVSGSGDCTLRIWDLEKRESQRNLTVASPRHAHLSRVHSYGDNHRKLLMNECRAIREMCIAYNTTETW